MVTQMMKTVEMDELIARLDQQMMSVESKAWPFVDTCALIVDLLKGAYTTGCRLITAGHIGPEIEIAADQADIELIETFGPSPFSGDIKSVIEKINSTSDILYVSSPNRVTGSTFSLADLEKIAAAVPDGLMIVDEYYFDYYGVTAESLLEDHHHVVVLRSFAAPFGIGSSDIGYALATPEMINSVCHYCESRPISGTVRRAMMTMLDNGEAIAMRIRDVHKESLRVANKLTRMGVQCRLTSADFLLLRVADPAAVGNALARSKVPVVNLDGYPGLENYTSYYIQSPDSNDILLSTFERMPYEKYLMKNIDKRVITMRLDGETTLSEQTSNRIAGITTKRTKTEEETVTV